MYTALIVGESHTGKTQSLSTLPGRSVLFNFETPDNVASLRIPYEETPRLINFWKVGKKPNPLVVVQYTLTTGDITLSARPQFDKKKIEWLIEDVNSIRQHLGEVDNIIIESLAPLAQDVLEFVVASNSRNEIQIQDYNVAIKKLANILSSIAGMGKNFIMTGHLQSEKDEITGRSRVSPQVWGKTLPNDIPKAFGEVFATTIQAGGGDKVKYQWLTQPEPNGFLKFLGSRHIDGLAKLIDQNFGYLDQASKVKKEKAA